MAFALEAQTSIEVKQGESATALIRILATSRPYRNVSLSLAGLPSGVSAVFSPSSGKPSFQSTLTLRASSTSATGTFTATVTARDAKSSKIMPVVVRNYAVNLPPSEPPPEVGTTFALMNAESGSITGEWETWGVISDGTNPVPVISTDRFKNGTHSFKYVISTPTVGGRNDHYSQTLSGSPDLASMGDPQGKYLSGFYSAWLYVDTSVGNFGENDWNMLLGWMTGVGGAPSPICSVELRRPSAGGVLQLVFQLGNARPGNVCGYSPPDITNYTRDDYYYYQSGSSPNGVTTFPTDQWVHVEFEYTSAVNNGRVKMWQDGVLVMDLTHANMNTMYGWSLTCSNTDSNLIFQFGIYGGNVTVQKLMYADDIRVTDYRVYPTL